MKNNDINNHQTKYNPLKDPSFWTVFVLGGGPIIFIMLAEGFTLTIPTILNIIFLISWEAWIIIKRGKKWSLVVGFIVAAAITGVAFFFAVKIDEKNHMKEREKMMEELRKKIQLDMEKSKPERIRR